MLSIEGALKKIQDTLQTSLRRVGGGAKFFSSATRKGEAAELQADLNSSDRDRQKNALKRIVANMTLGRDVSQLFPDVVKLGQAQNLEIKKLVYLYILNTAKLQPEKALLAVNTFLLDTQHSSPIVQGLALRTMLCLRTDTVLEHCIAPIIKSLASTDAYVRKTAAICVGKLYHQSPKSVEDHHILPKLVSLLSDSFPIVASNAAATLAEIAANGGPACTLGTPSVNALLHSLGDASEWGKVYILDLLATFSPSPEDAENMLARVTPQLSHANSAVVLATIKTVASWVQRMLPELRPPYVARINAALVTLIHSDAETQFVVCKNIVLLLEVFPHLLAENLAAFFIRFNDPPYVKVEKLRLILRLMNSTTAPSVIQELTEYATEVDPLFAQQVVAAVAQAAMKVEAISLPCATLLLHIVERRPELLSDVVNAAKNIVRKYPALFPQVVAPLLQKHNAANVSDEDAKVSLVWMLGEFCDQIPNGMELVQQYVDSFTTQETGVQLAMLTATVKIFLRNPRAMEGTINFVLESATRVQSSPDLRDRAHMYWRLLEKGIGVERMKAIVHSSRRPPLEVVSRVSATMSRLEIVQCLNTTSAILARPARTFVPPYGVGLDRNDDEDDDDGLLPDVEPMPETILAPPSGAGSGAPPVTTQVVVPQPAPVVVDPLAALFGPTLAPASSGSSGRGGTAADVVSSLFDPTPVPAAQQQHVQPATGTSSSASTAGFFDMLGAAAGPPVPVSSGSTLPLVMDSTAAHRVRYFAEFGEDSTQNLVLAIDAMCLDSPEPLGEPAVQFNRNAFGVAPQAKVSVTAGGANVWRVTVPTSFSAHHAAPGGPAVQVGIKTSRGLATFVVPVPARYFFAFAHAPAPGDFANQWRGMAPTLEKSVAAPSTLTRASLKDLVGAATMLRGAIAASLTGPATPAVHAVYGIFKLRTGPTVFFEMKASADVSKCQVTFKGPQLDEVMTLLEAAVRAIGESVVG